MCRYDQFALSLDPVTARSYHDATLPQVRGCKLNQRSGCKTTKQQAQQHQRLSIQLMHMIATARSRGGNTSSATQHGVLYSC
jgi:hypothetical protein